MIEKIVNNNQHLEDIFKEIIKPNRIENDLKNNPFSNYYIYRLSDKIIGFINFDIMYERMELIDIFVLEEYRNCKIATKLMDVMIEVAVLNNIDSITLEVRKDNYYAIKLYEKYGFTKVGIRKNYYKDIDGLLMKKQVK